MLLLVWGWEAVGPCGCAAEMFQCFLSVAARILPVSAGTWRPLLWGWGMEAPSRPGKPGTYQLCIKTLRSSRSAASLS